MNATQMTNPAPWSETDEQFFRIVGELFPPAFLWGATTLLGSYDPDPEPEAAPGRQPSREVARANNGVDAGVRTT